MNKKTIAWVLLAAVGVVGVVSATWLTIWWTRAGGVFAGVLITYPLGGLGGVFAGYAVVRLLGTWSRRRRIAAEVFGGCFGFLAHTVGYAVTGSGVDLLATLGNTAGIGMFVALVATFLMEASTDLIVAILRTEICR